MTTQLRAWRSQLSTFLNREAKVKDLLKATLPLWLCLACGTIIAIGVLMYQASEAETSRLRQRTDSCQIRNSAQEAARQDNVGIIDTVEIYVTNPLIIDALRESQSLPAIIDTDCNDDGFLTTADYVSDIYPLNLPLAKEKP